MDKLILEKKVDSILRCINRINTRIPQTEQEFLTDLDAQDVVILNLTRMIQTSVDIATHMIATSGNTIPETMSGAFSELEKLNIIPSNLSQKMKKSVGFRNLAVHSYDEINLSITYSIAHNHLNDFTVYSKHILDSLD